MTLAERFIKLWTDPTRSIAARTLAHRLDRACTFTKGTARRYTFTDGSEVSSVGSGRWRITKSEKDTPDEL